MRTTSKNFRNSGSTSARRAKAGWPAMMWWTRCR